MSLTVRRKQRKPHKESKKMKIRKLMVEISDMENTMHDQKINVKTVFLKKFSKLDKHLTKLVNN